MPGVSLIGDIAKWLADNTTISEENEDGTTTDLGTISELGKRKAEEYKKRIAEQFGSDSPVGKALAGSDAASIGGNQGRLSMVNSAQDINYLNAPLAEAYGMDASTAYQEALSRSAYQRAVQDAQNAGLNPALMFSSGSSAASFSGSMPKVSGGSAKQQKGLDVSGIGAALGAVAGLLIGKNPQGMYAGKEVGSAVGSIVEGLVDLSQNK